MWCGPCLHRRFDSTGGFLQGHQRRLEARCCLGARYVEVFRHMEPVLQQIPALNGSRLHFSSFRLVKSSRTLHIQSPAGPQAQPPACGPTTKGPGLGKPLWEHIPRAKTGSGRAGDWAAPSLSRPFSSSSRTTLCSQTFVSATTIYCQFMTRTWYPKVCSESRLVDSLYAAPAIFSVVICANYRSCDGPTMVRFRSFAAAQQR